MNKWNRINYHPNLPLGADGKKVTLTDEFGDAVDYEPKAAEAEAPAESSEAESAEPEEEENPYAKALLGTWIDLEGGYNEGITFNPDMTGNYFWDEEGGRVNNAFTYSFNFDESLHIEYEDGGEIDSTIVLEDDKLMLYGTWGSLNLTKQ